MATVGWLDRWDARNQRIMDAQRTRGTVVSSKRLLPVLPILLFFAFMMGGIGLALGYTVGALVVWGIIAISRQMQRESEDLARRRRTHDHEQGN